MILLPLLLTLASVTITPTPSPASSEIQKIREVIQQKVKEKINEITKEKISDPKKAYIGVITNIDTFTIKISFDNQTQDLRFDENTVFIGSKLIKIKVASLKVGQEILVLGLHSDDGDYLAKRIIVVDLKTIKNTQSVLSGKIVDLPQSSPIILLILNSDKNTQVQLKYDPAKLEIVDSLGKKIKLDTLKTGQKIVAIYNTQNQNTQYITIKKIIVL